MLLAQTRRDRKETHAPLYTCTRVEYEVPIEFVFIERYAMPFCQLTKWPHTGPRKHMLCDAVLST